MSEPVGAFSDRHRRYTPENRIIVREFRTNRKVEKGDGFPVPEDGEIEVRVEFNGPPPREDVYVWAVIEHDNRTTADYSSQFWARYTPEEGMDRSYVFRARPRMDMGTPIMRIWTDSLDRRHHLWESVFTFRPETEADRAKPEVPDRDEWEDQSDGFV